MQSKMSTARLAGRAFSLMVVLILAACVSNPPEAVAAGVGKIRAVSLQLLEELGLTSGGQVVASDLQAVTDQGATTTNGIVANTVSGTGSGVTLIPDSTDPNTGWRTSAADRLEAQTNGFDRFTIDNTIITIKTPNLIGSTTLMQSFGIANSNQTGDATEATAQTSRIVTNIGSSGTITRTLPTGFAFPGLYYRYAVVEANEMRIDPQAGDKIIDPDLPGLVDGEYMSSSTPGATLTVMSISTGDFVVLSKVGTWAEETP